MRVASLGHAVFAATMAPTATSSVLAAVRWQANTCWRGAGPTNASTNFD